MVPGAARRDPSRSTLGSNAEAMQMPDDDDPEDVMKGLLETPGNFESATNY